MEIQKHHITPYRFYLFILATLVAFTIVSVMVTTIELGPLSTFTALALASLKSVLVLMYFMHLRFDHILFKVMFVLVLLIFIAIIIVTMVDSNLYT